MIPPLPRPNILDKIGNLTAPWAGWFSALQNLLTPSNQIYFNVKADFGATGNGTTDDTTALQKAITYVCGIPGGILYFPPGTYLISSTLYVTAPIRMIGAGWGVSTTATIISGSGITEIRCSSAFPAKPAIIISAQGTAASPTATILFGGEMSGIQVNGNVRGGVINSLCTICVQASSCYLWTFNLCNIAAVTTGFQLDNGNNQLSAYNDIHCFYNSTGQTGAANSTGMNLYQGVVATNQGSTLNKIWYVGGLVQGTTPLVNVGGDNNVFVQCAGSVHFVNSGNNLGWNNVIHYCIGTVTADTGTYGNRVWNLDGVNDSITLTGTAQLHYSVLDSVTSGNFSTPPLLDVRDTIFRAAGLHHQPRRAHTSHCER